MQLLLLNLFFIPPTFEVGRFPGSKPVFSNKRVIVRNAGRATQGRTSNPTIFFVDWSVCSTAPALVSHPFTCT